MFRFDSFSLLNEDLSSQLMINSVYYFFYKNGMIKTVKPLIMLLSGAETLNLINKYNNDDVD